MKVIRRYNNNIILANDGGHEVIVLGKGLGFQVNPGSPVDTSLVEKVFIPQETVQISRFADTLSDLSYEHILLATKIVDNGKELLQTKLNPSIIVALADHFSVTLTRLLEHIDVQSPLKWDLRYLYPREFEAGMQGLEIIRRELQITLPEYEAASIALHFINAEIDSADMSTTFKIVAITSDIIGIIKECLHISFDEESFDLMPFVIHLRNLVLKYTVHPDQKVLGDDDLYTLVMQRYPESAECCKRICGYLRETHDWEPVRNDRLFLTLHIRRITESLTKK
jgi:beta-glucoside operon transcriptional antiterminator